MSVEQRKLVERVTELIDESPHPGVLKRELKGVAQEILSQLPKEIGGRSQLFSTCAPLLEDYLKRLTPEGRELLKDLRMRICADLHLIVSEEKLEKRKAIFLEQVRTRKAPQSWRAQDLFWRKFGCYAVMVWLKGQCGEELFPKYFEREFLKIMPQSWKRGYVSKPWQNGYTLRRHSGDHGRS